jgi:TDG/mug DNA glycosylase family protein
MRLLDDVICPGLRLVVCGTALGRKSAETKAYYAGPGNRFWPVLAETGLTPRLLRPYEYRELLGFGIGLTDVVKDQAGADADIHFSKGVNGRLLQTISLYRPRVLCFNGKRAAREALREIKEYGWQTRSIGPTRVFVAPSTSGAARRWWGVEPWHIIAAYVREEIRADAS